MTSTDMKSLLELLTERVSHGALGGPGPAADQITEIVRAGLRAPDLFISRGIKMPFYGHFRPDKVTKPEIYAKCKIA